MSQPAPTDARVPARVGLVGNPSDGFGGAVLAAAVDVWAADAAVTPIAHGLRIRNESLGAIEWTSPEDLGADIADRGHPAMQEIVTAALVALGAHLPGGLPPVELEWSSTIPRSVGLAGSSAIALAVIEAVAASTGHALDPRVAASVALQAETVELGIAAGWQDRMVQAHRRAVLVDAADMTIVDGRDVPAVEVLPALDVEAVVGWRRAVAEDSGTYHGAIRRRATSPTVVTGMRELAGLARRAARHAARRDVDGMVELVDASWRTRRAAVPLHPAHARLVEAVRAVGARATSPGSGGSVVAFATDRASVDDLRTALDDIGADTVVTGLH